MADFNEKLNEITNTADSTAEMDANDIQNNKVFAILAYIGILVLVTIFGAKESKFARFHANQGLVLLICGAVVDAIFGVLCLIPVVRIVFVIIGGLVTLVWLALMVLGIVNSARGYAKELPVIGKFKILK